MGGERAELLGRPRRAQEIKSIGSQLSFCYSTNRSTPNPVPFLITSLNGRLKARMDSANRKAHESWRDVEWWEEGYQELWKDDGAEVDLGHMKGKKRSRSRREDVVYLTADSPNVLSELEEGKTYVLGGIVDRSVPSLLL